MNEAIKQIEERIELYETLQENARNDGTVNMVMMYINQIIGLREALIILLKNK